MSEIAPNTDFSCNICGDKITSACMLSPDWSAKMQFESAFETMRTHQEKEHGVKRPTG